MFYTRSGDKGQTNVFGCRKSAGWRISKSSPKIEALGALDELNSLLGVCKVKSRNFEHSVFKILEDAQNDLFIIQGRVAGGDNKIKKNRIIEIEKIIDGIEKKLPKIENFIIAGGTELSVLLDYARAVARRAERRVAAIKKEVGLDSLKYLNRLSSLLFALARFVNKRIKEKKPRY